MNEEIRGPHTHLEEATIVELQAAMTSGELTAHRLAQMYIERISALDQQGPSIKSILEINPEALEIARALDEERHRLLAALGVLRSDFDEAVACVKCERLRVRRPPVDLARDQRRA